LLPLAGVTVAKTKVPSNYDAQLWEQQLSFDELTDATRGISIARRDWRYMYIWMDLTNNFREKSYQADLITFFYA